MSERLTLLVVDDNALEGRLVGGALADAFPDARIVIASEPQIALDACRAQRIDCALIDYNMPRVDGFELGKSLREEFAHLPLVLMTAVGDEMLAADALRTDFSDYIPKSRITKASIARTIARAMQSAEQARVIEEQREEIEHFAYALAHDFKQPIRQIRTFAELVAEEVAADRDTNVAKHLSYLTDASRRLGALVDVMSQYTLLNKPPELGMVDLDTVVAGVRSALSSFICERHGVFAAEPGATVYGNEALLAQALQNLVVNGLRYNRSAKPCVTLRVEEAPEGKRRLRIRDNGIGIEERYTSEIFKPLMRLHNSSEYPGTGLGLTITRKAVLAQGGTIWCRSELGAGSEFFIELCASAPAADGIAQPAAA
jgi:signal transduction histidine kinase